MPNPSPHSRHPIRLLINGARGRMGALVAALAQADSQRFTLAAQRDQGDDDVDILAAAQRAGGIDVVIDFSSDAGASDACRLARQWHAALLVGSTGLAPATHALLDQAARSIAVLAAPNTSLGVAVLAHVASEAARLLGPSFDIDITETHHAMKKDAPSGTALRLAKALRERGGETGARMRDERIASVRIGEVIGEHTIHFTGPGERLTMTHSATSRDLFARGALQAAAFLAGKPPGRYTIEQALGIER